MCWTNAYRLICFALRCSSPEADDAEIPGKINKYKLWKLVRDTFFKTTYKGNLRRSYNIDS